MASLGSTTRGIISDYRHEKVISCVVAWLTETGGITVTQQGTTGNGPLHDEFLDHVINRLQKNCKTAIVDK